MTYHRPKATALVVDDEYLIAVAVESCLIDMGFMVTVATTGEQALALVADNSFDVAVIDMHIGDPNATAAIARRLDERGIPFAICTGSVPAEARERFPARPIVEKPFLDEEIKQAIRTLTGERSLA